MTKRVLTKSFSLSDRHLFDKSVIGKIENNTLAQSLWPAVYILSDDVAKEAYIGESAQVISRITNHLSNPDRKKLSDLHLITGPEFNKSATLDIEASLIKYMGSDGRYKLQNGNLGQVYHNYYEKDEYSALFRSIWDELKDRNIVQKSLEEINNSDLFIYSPYKSLNTDQYSSIRQILDVLVNDRSASTFVEGSAGTGKTVLAVFLMKLLVTDLDTLFDGDKTETKDEKEIIRSLKMKYPAPKVALVVPMTSLRNTLKTVFRNIKGLSAKMVIGPSEAVKKKYDILLVDEAHRLRQRKNITNYRSFDTNNKRLKLGENGTELDWILKQSKKQIFFYDAAQSIKPSDVDKTDFDVQLKKSTKLKLHSQFRVKGDIDYISYIDKLLNSKLASGEPHFENENYEFMLFDSLEPLITRLNEKEKEHKLCRLVAGYSWKWKSKKNTRLHDIEIDGVKLKWNSEFNEWINSDNAINEVGCIHTTQGYDLNYTGVIFGKEISYDPETDQIVVLKENYHDSKGKIGIEDPGELKTYIINIYKTLMYRGVRGTYVYVCDKKLREYFKKHIPLFEKERNVKIIPLDSSTPGINSVPFYDIRAAAGTFSELQEATDVQWVALPEPYKAKEDYFVCKIVGESMNKKIPNGSLCLFQKDPGGSREGKIVLVAHHNINDKDFGAGYTVKSYHSVKEVNEDSWSHKRIILKPLSTDPTYKDLILNEDELSELKVVGIFVAALEL